MPDWKPLHPETTDSGLAPLRERLRAGAHADASAAIDSKFNAEDLEDRVAAGVAKGFGLIMSDDALISKFWHRGYIELTTHGTAGASQWVGRRLFTACVIAVTTAGIAYLLKNGALK